MSRFDYGDPGASSDYCDGLSEPGVIAHCHDCGDAFRTVIAEIGAKCDYCWTQRDAHADALAAASELKRMARCILTADLTTVKEIA